MMHGKEGDLYEEEGMADPGSFWFCAADCCYALCLARSCYYKRNVSTFEYGQKISLSSEDLFPDSKIIPDQIDLDLCIETGRRGEISSDRNIYDSC